MGATQELKILLAEDNKINQRIAAMTFNLLGVKCDIASNGQEAYAMHQQNLYDLILMDLQMPVMDGLESTLHIRAFEKETNQPHRVFIVALTANNSSEKKQVCIDAGMDDFMEKPLQENLLRSLFSHKF